MVGFPLSAGGCRGVCGGKRGRLAVKLDGVSLQQGRVALASLTAWQGLFEAQKGPPRAASRC